LEGHALPQPSHQHRNRTFVLKAYCDEWNRCHYDNERKALTALQSHPSDDHIITYYGSFEQRGKLCLVLEYVDGGNLFDFLKNTEPPQAESDIRDLWASINGIFKGFHRIHQWTSSPKFDPSCRVVHQDIKPDNILLVRNGPSPYNFHVKIADFGFSHVRLAPNTDTNPPSIDQHGNPKYSAPECSHHTRDLQTGIDPITPEADTFGLGAILSEIAGWIAFGPGILEEYCVMRKKETRLNPELFQSGYDESFHNGADVLEAVDQMRQMISEKIPGDSITNRILQVIHGGMLVARAGERLAAKVIRAKFDDILKDYQKCRMDSNHTPSLAVYTNLSPSSSSSRGAVSSSTDQNLSPAIIPTSGCTTPCTPSPSTAPLTKHEKHGRALSDSKTKSLTTKLQRLIGSPTHGDSATDTSAIVMTPLSDLMSSSNGGFLKLDDISRYRHQKKNGEPADQRVEEMCMKLQTNLGQRDHLFFIDDSVSMDAHRNELTEAFTSLSYIAKQLDQNGIEMCFASTPKVILGGGRTHPMIEALTKQQFCLTAGMMEDKLGVLFDNKIIPRLPRKLSGLDVAWSRAKPISIFILTDGRWGTNLEQAAGVQTPVKKLMDKIKSLELNRTQVMLQFLRFGDDPDGIRYLNFLDQFGRRCNW
jgi:serine/threonine protein kinase